jgi:hypothetical protein
MIVFTALFLVIASSSLPSASVSIGSSGTIRQPAQPVGEPSEIRGVFVKWLDAGTTWETLAASYQPYGVNWLVGEACGTMFSRSNLDSLNIHNIKYDYIGEGIKAAHAHGMKFTAMMLVGFRGSAPLDPNIDCVNQNGSLIHWTCPVKAHDLIVSICKEIATKYPDLDGFMYDYCRYTTDYDYMDCFCEQCHQRFVQDTGLTGVNWPADVLSGGRYYNQWFEWRVKPILDLVNDTRAAMLAINPKLEFSIATLSLWYENGQGYGFPIRKWFGQDTATMVSRGYLDVVCPMQYTANLTLLGGTIDTNTKYLVGGSEGKVPIVPIIGGMETSSSDMTPAQLTACINLCRQKGTDGFLIYRQIPGFVQNYLSQIPKIPTFTMSDLQPHKNPESTTFTWTTSTATSSMIEYSTSPLFSVQELTWNGFKYYEVTHSTTSAGLQNATLTINHSITIPFNATTPLYFRVQSADANNILSSPQLIYDPESNNITRVR